MNILKNKKLLVIILTFIIVGLFIIALNKDSGSNKLNWLQLGPDKDDKSQKSKNSIFSYKITTPFAYWILLLLFIINAINDGIYIEYHKKYSIGFIKKQKTMWIKIMSYIVLPLYQLFIKLIDIFILYNGELQYLVVRLLAATFIDYYQYYFIEDVFEKF